MIAHVMNSHTPHRFHQKGAALVMSLVMMAVITIIGISTLRNVVDDVRVSRIMKDRANAFQCAEAALRTGEIWLAGLTERPEPVGSPVKASNQVWDFLILASTASGGITNQTSGWWATNGWSYEPDAGGNTLQDADYQTGCANTPNYIVELLGEVNSSPDLKFSASAESKSSYYRITAYSTGSSSNARVILQSTFAREFN